MYLRMKQESDCLPHVGHRYRVCEKQSNTSKTRWVCQQIATAHGILKLQENQVIDDSINCLLFFQLSLYLARE
jgi:hypothetical protein